MGLPDIPEARFGSGLLPFGAYLSHTPKCRVVPDLEPSPSVPRFGTA